MSSARRSKLVHGGHQPIELFGDELERLRTGLPTRINADPENAERGLAQLVLTLVELIRQLMERQALRRVEAGGLDDDQVERLGQAFMRLDQRMKELLAEFELTEQDLALNLGPLGDLM
jgi:CII-binding regulator of phage lambda lysogenization HflD